MPLAERPIFGDFEISQRGDNTTMETNAMFIRQFIIGAFDSLNQGDFYKLCDALLAGAKAFMEHPPKDITDLNGAWNAGCYFGKAILTELSK